MSSSIFVEHLTFIQWVFQIFPASFGLKKSPVFVFDASPITLRITKLFGRFFGIQIEKLDFRLVDIKDENGLLVREKIPYDDLIRVQEKILSSDFFAKFLKSAEIRNRMPTYIAKNISDVSFLVQANLQRALLLIQIAVWVLKGRGDKEVSCHLYLENRSWFSFIEEYGLEYGILVRELLPRFHVSIRKGWFQHIYHQFLYYTWHVRFGFKGKFPNGKREKPDLPMVAVEYYGQFNLEEPHKHSDFFFLQQSQLSGKNVMATFGSYKNPLDDEKWNALQKHGIRSVIVHPRATKVPHCPPLRPKFYRGGEKNIRAFVSSSSLAQLEKKWLKETLRSYDQKRSYWKDIFQKQNAKIYLSWYRYDGSHCAIADAIRDLGGVMAIYQRALDTVPLIDTRVDVDIVFGFSKFCADLDRKTKSTIPHFVVTGYLGDHRFALLRDQAKKVRENLKKNGATHIITYLDENSAEDSRWHTGHEFMRVNYDFLFRQVLSDSTIGLVLKPKVPHTLRRRLGPVAALLDEALGTGRVYFYDRYGYPPCAAALASDVTIHGHLSAGTAGMECALAGVPTLLLDRESWPVSPLYQLGVGKVVFTDWPSLWGTCQEHWKNPKGIPGFGDWSSMINEFDPFRDGRAAERMGTYTQWLLESFRTGSNREEAMEEASTRYRKTWGQDKVFSVNC